MIVSQVGISGSTTVGDHVTLAGQVGVAGHLTIGDNVMVGAKSGVPNSLAANAGTAATRPSRTRNGSSPWRLSANLPALKKTVNALEKRLAELEELLKINI